MLQNNAAGSAEEHDEFAADEYIVRKKKAPAPQLQVTPAGLAGMAGETLEALRAKAPMVQCLVNAVAPGFVANALLALGARPVVTRDSGECTQCAGMADGLVVNVGTVTKTQSEAMRAAVARANASQKPWALDPAAVGVLSMRSYVAKELIRRFPSAIRGNPLELMALAGIEMNGRSVGTEAEVAAVVKQAKRLAGITRAAVAMTTDRADYVCGENAPTAVVANASPLRTRVAGFGCMQTALVAAFVGILGRARRYEATVAALLVTTVAAEIASARAKAPGSFAVAFLDALYELKPADLAKRAKVTLAE